MGDAIRYKCLDLFCGAGGVAKGLQRAGFSVLGIDIIPQPNYCGDAFIQADATEFPDCLDGFDFIWASPPCQFYTSLRNMNKEKQYPDLIDAVRRRLVGRCYVIENVVGAPLENPAMLCGSVLCLRTDDGAYIQRHRLFESSVRLISPGCNHAGGACLGVYGDMRRSRRSAMRRGIKSSISEAKQMMGIDWMTPEELVQAIPPNYAKFLGAQVIEHLDNGTAFGCNQSAIN